MDKINTKIKILSIINMGEIVFFTLKFMVFIGFTFFFFTSINYQIMFLNSLKLIISNLIIF